MTVAEIQPARAMTPDKAASHLGVSHRVIALAAKGSGSNDESRILTLLSGLEVERQPFDRSRKVKSACRLLSRILAEKPDLVVLEGTGLAPGAACIVGRLLGGTRYVVSSGDAVGPWIASHARWAGPAFALYERILCRLCAGFIGWTPYLVGRALTFGAPRAMTAAGWADKPIAVADRAAKRCEMRRRLGIEQDDLVFGIAGAIRWNPRVNYCYGLDLVRAQASVRRTDVTLLIVGGGTGLERLRKEAGDRLGRSVILTGEVPGEEVSDHLAAMDVASLPQSTDGVGSFRYTTKISEYLAAGLPVVTGRIPMAYDLDDGADRLWRLPGVGPWDPKQIAALTDLMETLDRREINHQRAEASSTLAEFDRDLQVRRATAFFNELLAERDLRKTHN